MMASAGGEGPARIIPRRTPPSTSPPVPAISRPFHFGHGIYVTIAPKAMIFKPDEADEIGITLWWAFTQAARNMKEREAPMEPPEQRRRASGVRASASSAL